MQLPFAKYLLWLHLRGQTVTEIDRTLDELSFPRVGAGVHASYAQRAAGLPLSHMTRKRLLRSVYNAEIDLPTFTKLGLREVYQTLDPDHVVPEQISEILGNPILRVALESCLLAKVGQDEIKALVIQTHKVELNDAVVTLYQRIYFDTASMTKVDWREYLRTCTEDNYIYVRYLAALTQPIDEVLHLVGLPTKPVFSNLLRSILSTAEYKFKRYSGHGTQEGDELAMKWAKAGIVAGVQYEKFSAADATDFSAVLQTEFEFLPDDIPNVTGEMLSCVVSDKSEEQDKAVIHNPPPLIQPEFEV